LTQAAQLVSKGNSTRSEITPRKKCMRNRSPWHPPKHPHSCSRREPPGVTASTGNRKMQTAPHQEDHRHAGPSAVVLVQHHLPPDGVIPPKTGPRIGCLAVATTITQRAGASPLPPLDLALVASKNHHARGLAMPATILHATVLFPLLPSGWRAMLPPRPQISINAEPPPQADLTYLLHPRT
jgi:hypothetical protein